MRKIRVLLIAFLMLSGIFSILGTLNIVSATSYSYNWDNVSEYAFTGSYGIFSWSRLSGNHAWGLTTINGAHVKSPPLSLYMSETVGDKDSTNITLSSAIPLNSFVIWFYFETTNGQQAGDSTIQMMKDNGEELLTAYFIDTDVTHSKITILDYGLVQHDVGTLPEGEYCYFKYQNNHSSTNPINYVYYEVGNTTQMLGCLECSNLYALGGFNQSVSYFYLTCDSSFGSFEINYDDFSYGTDAYESTTTPIVYDTYCGSEYYGDKTINNKYLEITGGTIRIGRVIHSLSIQLQDIQYITYHDLTKYYLYAFNHDFGNPSRWEKKNDNYYYLIWDDMNYIWSTTGNAIELKTDYNIWYISAGVPSMGYLYAHSNDTYWKNNAYMDGTYQDCGLTYCISFFPQDIEYSVTFNCVYNTSVCLPFNNKIYIDYIISPACPIYYFLEDSGDFVITEGGYANNIGSFYFDFLMEQSYGSGNFTFYVMTYEDYLLHGRNKNYTIGNYSFCVSIGNLNSESIFTEKNSYYEGELITIYWRGVNNTMYQIWLGGKVIDTVKGDDSTHVLRDAGYLSCNTQKDERKHVALKFVSNSTDASIYYFTLKYVGNIFIYVKPNPVKVGNSVTISGNYGTGYYNDKYISVRYLGTAIDNITVGAQFSFPFKCTKLGDYTAYLMGDGTVLDSYSWKATEDGITNPNEGTGIDTYIGVTIPPEIKLFIAIIIIAVFTLIPILFIFVVNSKRGTQLSVPPIVYGIFMALGIAVSIGIGFMDYWVMFFVLFFAIMVFAISWIAGKKSEG